MLLALTDVRKKLPNVLYAIVGNGETTVSRGTCGAQHLTEHVQFLGEVEEEELVTLLSAV